MHNLTDQNPAVMLVFCFMNTVAFEDHFTGGCMIIRLEDE
jgi:hypothetical protein